MSAVVRLAESVAEEESSGFGLSLTLGVTVFVLFALLLFAVTRLNPDR